MDRLDDFEELGFLEWRNFITEKTAMDIRLELEELEQKEQFRPAAIGKDTNTKVDSDQRSDFIRWIDPPSAGPATALFLSALQDLITDLNRNFYLGIRDFECHYTHYPPGSFYKRHRDRHHSGSHRIVSFVLYLNKEWTENDGGQLCIYADSETLASISPQLATLAVFLSDKEHEVLITQRDRMSITGWMLTEKIL